MLNFMDELCVVPSGILCFPLTLLNCYPRTGCCLRCAVLGSGLSYSCMPTACTMPSARCRCKSLRIS
uniref:Uncharacterized protein n=1 Tax=Physcomitrium patens TaxID=3218 RepID=A0A2K1J307_PHYPA|nr:hypothetical protein PHYPA_021756 [Physcomitrium patens]